MGMVMYFTEKGAVELLMTGYIYKAVDELPKYFTTLVVIPASDHMFKRNNSGKRLGEKGAILFRRIVERFLFVINHASIDIHPTVVFLTTSMQESDEDYWKNLQCLKQHLHGTHEMALHLNCDDLNIIHWWLYASYVVHNYIKVHTGATMYIGRVYVTSMSKKHNINTTRSTQGEVVGVYDTSPQMMWNRYFLSNQGFKIDNSILYHYNKSAILLE